MQQENAELLALQRIDDTGTKLQQEVQAMLMHMVRGASCLSCQTDGCTALLVLLLLLLLLLGIRASTWRL